MWHAAGEPGASRGIARQIAKESSPQVELLKQVKGVGTQIALTYVLTLDDPHRFPKSREVGCFLGLCPGRSGAITSDCGGLLLREVEKRIGILRQFAACFTDYRNPDLIEHTVEELIAQRVFGLALGYEDLNDHEELRNDPLLAVLVEKGNPGSQVLVWMLLVVAGLQTRAPLLSSFSVLHPRISEWLTLSPIAYH